MAATLQAIEDAVLATFGSDILSIYTANDYRSQCVEIEIKKRPGLSDELLEQFLEDLRYVGIEFNTKITTVVSNLVEQPANPYENEFIQPPPENRYRVRGDLARLFKDGRKRHRGDTFTKAEMKVTAASRIRDLMERGLITLDGSAELFRWSDGQVQAWADMSNYDMAILGSICSPDKSFVRAWTKARVEAPGYDPLKAWPERIEVLGRFGNFAGHADPKIIKARDHFRDKTYALKDVKLTLEGREIFRQALNAMPSKFKKNRKLLKWLVPIELDEIKGLKADAVFWNACKDMMRDDRRDARNRIAKRLGVDPRYVSKEQIDTAMTRAAKGAPTVEALRKGQSADIKGFLYDRFKNRYAGPSYDLVESRYVVHTLFGVAKVNGYFNRRHSGQWEWNAEFAACGLSETLEAACDDFETWVHEQLAPKNVEAAPPRVTRHIGTGDLGGPGTGGLR